MAHQEPGAPQLKTLEACEAGDSIEPGVKRSVTPGSLVGQKKSPRSGRQPLTGLSNPWAIARSACLRFWLLGVPLRFTPGFMLTPATRAPVPMPV